MSGTNDGAEVDHVELDYGVATDVGHVREVNEDSYLARPPVFVVADGM
jgi:protein phosphatase